MFGDLHAFYFQPFDQRIGFGLWTTVRQVSVGSSEDESEEEESSESTLEQLLGNWTVHKDQIIKCNEDSLHRLAQVALRLKKSVLNAPGFMANLIHEMERLEIEVPDLETQKK